MYITRKLFERLHLSYYGRSIFTKFYWRTLSDRRRLGFDETETWSLDSSLSKLIAPRITMFIKFADSSIPTRILMNEYEKSHSYGYKWDTKRACIANEDERKRCWARAGKRWLKILTKIKDGFDDEVLEAKDYDAWVNKWSVVANKYNKALAKAKTQKEQEEIWASIKTWRKYDTVVNGCTVDDVVYNLRREARYLLAEYYNDLWW